MNTDAYFKIGKEYYINEEDFTYKLIGRCNAGGDWRKYIFVNSEKCKRKRFSYTELPKVREINEARCKLN